MHKERGSGFVAEIEDNEKPGRPFKIDFLNGDVHRYSLEQFNSKFVLDALIRFDACVNEHTEDEAMHPSARVSSVRVDRKALVKALELLQIVPSIIVAEVLEAPPFFSRTEFCAVLQKTLDAGPKQRQRRDRHWLCYGVHVVFFRSVWLWLRISWQLLARKDEVLQDRHAMYLY